MLLPACALRPRRMFILSKSPGQKNLPIFFQKNEKLNDSGGLVARRESRAQPPAGPSSSAKGLGELPPDLLILLRSIRCALSSSESRVLPAGCAQHLDTYVESVVMPIGRVVRRQARTVFRRSADQQDAVQDFWDFFIPRLYGPQPLYSRDCDEPFHQLRCHCRPDGKTELDCPHSSRNLASLIRTIARNLWLRRHGSPSQRAQQARIHVPLDNALVELESREHSGWSKIQVLAAKATLIRMPENERNIVIDHLSRVSVREIQEKYGLTKYRVQQVIERRMDELRQACSEYLPK